MFAWLKRRWARLLLELVVLLLIVAALHAYTTRTTISGTAPAFAGTLLRGTPVSLNAMRGEPVLVHFWATWCPVCRTEQGSVASVAQDYQVVTVAMQSGGAHEVEQYLNEQGVRMPVLVDNKAVLAQRYGVTGVPTTFVVDGDGKIRFVEVGYTTELGIRLRLWLASLW
jgi:thiol-disulfide isomerase/thioredoxin